MISLLVLLILVGVLLYVVGLIPMDPAILNIIRVVTILCVVFYLLRVFGIVDLPLPRVK